MEPKHDIDAITDPNEIPQLTAVHSGWRDLNKRAWPVSLIWFKQLHRDRALSAFVILIGTIDIEEFQSGPLRRMAAHFRHWHRINVEELFRLPVPVQRREGG